MTLIRHRINDGHPRNAIGQLVSVAHMTAKGFHSWCERELRKVPGGMDGLIKTEHGYSDGKNHEGETK